MNLQITITDEYIQAGIPDNSDQCPIALAIKDATGLSVSVLPSAIYISMSADCHVRYTPSDEVTAWIRNYDEWGFSRKAQEDLPPPPPITVTLEDIYVYPAAAE